MKIHTSELVPQKMASYPPEAKEKLDTIRKLILETASEIEGIEDIHESLKWGEPSYLVKKGTPIRIAWSSKRPDQIGFYVNCQTTLINQFRMTFGELFEYEKTRAILFEIGEAIPETELKACIRMALVYHRSENKNPLP